MLQKQIIAFLLPLLIVSGKHLLFYFFAFNLKAQQWIQFFASSHLCSLVITSQSNNNNKCDTHCYLAAGFESPGAVWLAETVSTLLHACDILTRVQTPSSLMSECPQNINCAKILRNFLSIFMCT